MTSRKNHALVAFAKLAFCERQHRTWLFRSAYVKRHFGATSKIQIHNIRKKWMPSRQNLAAPCVPRVPFLVCDLACLVCTVQIKVVLKAAASRSAREENSDIPACRRGAPGRHDTVAELAHELNPGLNQSPSQVFPARCHWAVSGRTPGNVTRPSDSIGMQCPLQVSSR